MPIKVTLPATSNFSVSHLFGIIDYLTTDAIVTNVTATQFSGVGTFNGASVTFLFNGTGFSVGQIGGVNYVNTGTLQQVVFSSAVDGLVTFDTVNIDMAVFAPINALDDTGVSPLAVENFMMQKAWDIKLGNADDIAPKGTLVGDGAALNLIGNDIIRGRGGNDNLFSGDGDDKLFGNAGRDTLDGGKGNDLVKGGNGNDKLLGGAGRDNLFGENGKDVLIGGNQKDVLDGGKGNDILRGGGGADRFVFKDGYGRDRVKDFDANSNAEDIDLSGVTAITNFQMLKANFMEQIGTNVVIDDEAGTVITLIGVDLGDLGRGDFIF